MQINNAPNQRIQPGATGPALDRDTCCSGKKRCHVLRYKIEIQEKSDDVISEQLNVFCTFSSQISWWKLFFLSWFLN